MLTENGIEGTVDHLHRTIYGALLAGKTFQWMKKGPSKNIVSLGCMVYRVCHEASMALARSYQGF